MAGRKSTSDKTAAKAAEKVKATEEQQKIENIGEATSETSKTTLAAETESPQKSEAPKEPEASAKESADVQQVYQMVTPKDPMVKILYLDSVISTNQIPIGNGRMITGSGKIFNVTLNDFEGVFQTPLVTRLLQKRKFIVLDGLTKEQRIQYGVDYSEGEIIKNEGMFDWLLACGAEKAGQAYEALCPEHRSLVAARIHDAYERHDNRITRDLVETLNDISKADFEDGKGAFTDIIIRINEARI